MTLDEIFEKYSDEQMVYRTSIKHMSPKPVKWCKGLKGWGTESARQTGFIIPQFMIEDANANDWELANDNQ